MRYRKAIETLIKQIYEWDRLENFETVSEHITVLLNALSSKKPDSDLAKAFIKAINNFIFKLIDVKVIHTLQAISWIDKAVRLASSLDLTEEKLQLSKLKESLRVKLENVSSEIDGKNITTLLDRKSSQINTKNYNNQYKNYFDKIARLLSGKSLSNSEPAELIKLLKNIIFNNCQEGPNPKTEKLLAQTILLCQQYSLETEADDLIIIQQYLYSGLYPKEKIVEISNSGTLDELAEQQAKLELEIKALELIKNHSSISHLKFSDELSAFHLMLWCESGLPTVEKLSKYEKMPLIIKVEGYDLNLTLWRKNSLPTVEELSIYGKIPMLIKRKGESDEEDLFYIYGESKEGKKQLVGLESNEEFDQLDFENVHKIVISAVKNSKIHEEITLRKGHSPIRDNSNNHKDNYIGNDHKDEKNSFYIYGHSKEGRSQLIELENYKVFNQLDFNTQQKIYVSETTNSKLYNEILLKKNHIDYSFSDQLAIQLLALCQPKIEIDNKMVIDNDLQTSSFEYLFEITQRFLLDQDIGLSYQYLEQAIILAENLNLSEQRSRLMLAQGDLFSQKQKAEPNFKEAVTSLIIYFEEYFKLDSQKDSSKMLEIETKISALEICTIYHEAKYWIIQNLAKNSDTLNNFEKTFKTVSQIGNRLIAYKEFDLAWRFFADKQRVLTQLTQDWHEEILVKLADISCAKQNPKLLNVNDYPQVSDWQKYRTELMQYRQELAKTDTTKTFSSKQKFYTKSVMCMIAGWLKYFESLLGPRPDQFCIMAVGSMSRYTLGLYSDLECLLLVANSESAQWDNLQSEKAKYFSTLYRLLEWIMACLGEIRGFRLDAEGHARVEDRLRGTFEEVLRRNHQGTFGVRKDDEMTFSILSAIFLYGDIELEKKYYQYLSELLAKPVSKKDNRLWKDFLAVTYLAFHLKYYREHDLFSKKQEVSKQKMQEQDLSLNLINIKKDYISPIMYAIVDICLHYRMRFTNTVDFVKQLIKERKISPDFAKTILQGVQLADQIRVNLHFYYNEQNDEAMPHGISQEKFLTLTQEQQKIVTLIGWGLWRPLRFVLENLQKLDGKPLPEDEYNFLFNPLQGMIIHAVRSKDKNNIEIAVQSTLYALVLRNYDPKLVKTEVDAYRLAYLEMPPEARVVFQELLCTLKDYLSVEKINLIKQACLDCPLPNGIRENQKEKEKRFNDMLECLVVKENKNIKQKDSKDTAKIRWINSQEEDIQGNLHPEVVSYLTNKGYLKNGKLQITTEKIEESDGRHLVIHLDLDISKQVNSGTTKHAVNLYGKVFPEMPGMECALDELARLLTGTCVPYAQLVRLEIGGKVIPMLLSEAIIGKPLHIMIREKGDKLNELLNFRLFNKQVLFSIAANAEDKKPSNIIVREISKEENESLETICIDNDRSLFPSIVEEDGRLVPIVKDITYCFELMKRKVDPVVEAEIKHFDVYALLKQWLKQLEKINNSINKLFALEEMEEFFPKKGQAKFRQQLIKQVNTQHTVNESILSITLRENAIADLYVKLTRLQRCLEDSAHLGVTLSGLLADVEPSHSAVTLLDLLTDAEPYLARYYRNLLETFPNIVDRFNNGFSELYGEKPEKSGAHQTKKTTFATLQTLHGKPQDAKTVLYSKVNTFKMLDDELELIHSVQQHSAEIYRNIMKGASEGFKAFSELPDMRLRETIFNQIDFIKLGQYEQQLLNTLMQTKAEFRSLKLINSNITDDILNKILKDSPELVILVIDNCPLLTERTITNIAKNCPILETLSLTKLTIKAIDTGSLTIPSLFIPINGRATVVFAELRALNVSDCKNLSKLYIEAPKLSVLIANNCTQLRAGKCRSRELRRLELSHCISLTIEELAIFVTHFPYLKDVVLDNCVKIEEWIRKCLMRYPYLLRINLRLVTQQYREQLMILLEKFHKKVEGDDKQINQLLEKLSEYFDAIENGMPELIKLLSDESPYVQEKAVFYIKEIGRNSDNIIDSLEQQLLSSVPNLRAAAAIALCRIDKKYIKDQKITEILEKIFMVIDKDIFNMAIFLLNEFGSEAQNEELCLHVLKNGTLQRREMVVYALMHWTTYSEKISESLKESIQHSILNDKNLDYQTKMLCAYCCLEMKYNQKNFSLHWLQTETIQQLLILMTKSDPRVALAIRANLNPIKLDKKSDKELEIEIESIIQQIDGKNKGSNIEIDTWNENRIKIIQFIGLNQIRDNKILSCLLELLQHDKYFSIRVAVLETLNQLQLKTAKIEDAIIKSLDDRSHNVIQIAIKSLSTKSINKKEVRKKLLNLLLRDEHLEIKEAVLFAFESANEYHKEILDVAIKCLSHNLVAIRCAAIKVFVKLISLTVLETTLTQTFDSSFELMPKKQHTLISQKFVLGRRSSDKEEKSQKSQKSLFLENSPRRRESADGIQTTRTQTTVIQTNGIQTTPRSQPAMRGRGTFFRQPQQQRPQNNTIQSREREIQQESQGRGNRGGGPI